MANYEKFVERPNGDFVGYKERIMESAFKQALEYFKNLPGEIPRGESWENLIDKTQAAICDRLWLGVVTRKLSQADNAEEVELTEKQLASGLKMKIIEELAKKKAA